MNKLLLKITGTVVLVVAVIIAVYAFWPDEIAPVTESRDVKQIPKGDKTQLKSQQMVQQQPEAKEAFEPAMPRQPELVVQEKSITNAEKLYQIALLSKESDDSPDMSYKIVLDCCRLILEQHPNTPQAEKARELQQEVPEQYREQYAKEMRLWLPSKPAVKKSRPLRRRR